MDRDTMKPSQSLADMCFYLALKGHQQQTFGSRGSRLDAGMMQQTQYQLTYSTDITYTALCGQ